MAENAAFIRSFLRGTVDAGAYVTLLRNLLHIYEALEQQLIANSSDPRVGPLVLPEVMRARALANDLSFFSRAGSNPPAEPLPATLAYVSRLESLGRTAPQLLVSHAYVRYLGDLSGGQILRSIAARALGLSDGRGLEFYDFPMISDIATYKGGYRSTLDALPFDEAQKQELVIEAVLAFRLNMDLFDEIPGNALRSLGAFLVPNVLKRTFSHSKR